MKTNEDIFDVSKQIIELIATPNDKGLYPVDVLAGLLSITTGAIPDNIWERMMGASVKHCPNPDCDCHLISTELFAVLNKLREAWLAIRNE